MCIPGQRITIKIVRMKNYLPELGLQILIKIFFVRMYILRIHISLFFII